MSTHVAVPSPVVGAVDAVPLVEPRTERDRADRDTHAPCGVVKIGQTPLHNPSGRSSWIGLT